MSIIKILNKGGISKSISSLTKNLTDGGLDVTVLFLMREHADFFPIDPRVSKIYIDSFDTSYFKRAQNFNKKSFLKGKLKEFINYSYDYGSYMVLTGWINKNHHQFDEIITCWYKLSTYLTYTETASKTIAWEHIDHRIGGILYFNLLRKRYKKLKGIISLTGESKKFYEKIHNKVFKISNIVGDQYENFEYDKSKKDNIILLASRLDPEKNVKEFIDIISEVNFPNDWKVIIAGTGFIACEVENHAKKRCAITFNS